MKQKGRAPDPRFGHKMCFLKCSNAILVAGGRNDEANQQNQTRFFNDLFLFMLDQRVWIDVQYTEASYRFDNVGNHGLCVLSDEESYEKVLIFGGVSQSPG